jgi:uncharacterized membrane protein YtjA (UPF0391 family)
MIRAAVGFFVLAILAFILGANGIAGISLEIGKMLLGIFLTLSIITLLVGLVGGGGNTRQLR